MKEFFRTKLLAAPRYPDVFILAVFAILITLQPYFADGKINIFEVGLYLPGIQSVLNGEIPYRDFFHLRGPFELYMPALLMKMFGAHLKVLYSYFYFGNVLCLILCILIAKELLRTRLVLYLMVPVLIGRTWPRVVFAYWGGMRYAFGLLALWCMIKFFKKNKMAWMFAAGICSALAGFTSIEMGAYPFLGVLVALIISKILHLIDLKTILKSFGVYLAGFCVIAIPYAGYLLWHSAIIPYIDSVLTIVTRMQKVIDPHFVSVYPRNFSEAFAAMVNPVHTNFKHMTPSYLYIMIIGYLLVRLRRKTFSNKDLMVICLGVYGFIMYNTGFRGIWAAQFEMALQPEKILLFFMLEIFFLNAVERRSLLIDKLKVQTPVNWSNRDRWKVYGLNAFLFIFIFSSIGYSIQRYNHRFYAFKYVRDKLLGKNTDNLKPMANEETRPLKIARARGIIVPVEQADEIENIVAYLREHVGKSEEVLTYPDFGTYNFLADRRAFGRFPLATFTWFNDRWYNDFMKQLQSSRPRYVVLQKEIPQYWKDVYLALEPNRQKFQGMMDFIHSNYAIEAQTPQSYIYRLK